MRKSIIKFALCGGMLAGMLASCTGDYMDYNTNPYEATKDRWTVMPMRSVQH